jgi:tetratricopeptide (TPR) repeat protein
LPALPSVDTAGFSPAVREQFQEAIKHVQAHPEQPESNGKLGMLLHAYDRLEPALICYQRAAELQPQDYRWPYYTGVVHAASSRNKEAAAAFRRALELRPGDLAIEVSLADALLASGDYGSSRELYEKALAQRPDYAIALYGAGRAYQGEGHMAKAVELFQRACERFPRYAAALYALGLAYQKLGRTEEARKHLEAYERDKKSSPPREDSLMAAVLELSRSGVLSMLAKGKNLAAEGRVGEAIEIHLQVLKADPKQEQAHINLISLYGRQKEFEKAEQHYRSAAALNENRDEAHYNYAVLASSQGRVSEAEAAYRKTLAINPLHAEAHNNLGYLLAQRGEMGAALEHFRKALENRPDYPQAHFNAGNVLLRTGRHEEAIKHFQATIERTDENQPRYLYALATAHARAGDGRRALDYARQARQAAASRHQEQLVAAIDRDLRHLERTLTAR